MPPKAKVAKKKNGYQMPEEFKAGFVLKDVYKKPWCLGKPIGQGGFGLIYIANKGESLQKQPENGEYVVKIEPKENGPLFCETHFYNNCAKEDDIKSFMRIKSLKHLAMPKYISSGTCDYNEKEYRFLVMDRYSTDLQKVLDKAAGKRLASEIGTLCLIRQVLYTLEYIHQRGYAHGDIKGANLMLKSDSEAYLVDYGLAFRFMRDNVHQKYQIKPERRHNGTIEYTSRDAHDGAQISRRSDLEILAYCFIHWLSGTLPWICLIKNAEQVQQSKIKSMSNVSEFLKLTLGTVPSISATTRNFTEFYLSEVKKLEFETEPDYVKIQNKITESLQLLGHSKSLTDDFFIFAAPKASNKSLTNGKESKIVADDQQDEAVLKKKNQGSQSDTSGQKT